MSNITLVFKLCLAIMMAPLMASVADATDYNADVKTDHVRPGFVQVKVDVAYEKSANYKPVKEGKPRWLCNGRKRYNSCYSNEHIIFQETILKHPEQKVFYAADVGAGGQEWVDSSAYSINNGIAMGILPKDITVHILGLTGESCLKVDAQKVGNCLIYKYGQFKIEEIDTELSKVNAFKGGEFDLVMCQMCLRHLVDPLGTFIRIYNIIKPQRFFFFDKFHFLYEGEEVNDYLNNLASIEHMLALLSDVGAPFLFDSRGGRSPYAKQGFVLKTPENKVSYRISLSYDSLEQVNGQHFDSVSDSLIVFKIKSQDRKLAYIKSESYGSCYGDKETLFGDKGLFDELDKMNLWSDSIDRKMLEAPKYAEIPWKQ